jgi:hypothetical protein
MTEEEFKLLRLFPKSKERISMDEIISKVETLLIPASDAQSALSGLMKNRYIEGTPSAGFSITNPGTIAFQIKEQQINQDKKTELNLMDIHGSGIGNKTTKGLAKKGLRIKRKILSWIIGLAILGLIAILISILAARHGV